MGESWRVALWACGLLSGVVLLWAGVFVDVDGPSTAVAEVAHAAFVREVKTVQTDLPLAARPAEPQVPAPSQPQTVQPVQPVQLAHGAVEPQSDHSPREPVVEEAEAQSAEQSEICDTTLQLTASLHAPREPARSAAMLRLSAGKRAGLYRRGMHVGSYELLAVRERAVLLGDGQSTCWLGMRRASPAATRARSQTARRSTTRPAKTTSASTTPTTRDLSKGIKRLGPNRYQVDRAVLDSALASATGLTQGVSVKPVRAYGKVVGVRVMKDGRGLLSRLGVRRGDVLRRINGFALSDAQALLGARKNLASADHVTLTLSRRGRTLPVDYTVR